MNSSAVETRGERGNDSGPTPTEPGMPGGASGKTSVKLFVGGVPPSSTHDTVHEYFSQYGDVLSAQVMYDRKSNISRGFAFVTMDTEGAAKVETETQHLLDGKDIEVKRAVPKSYTAGGGLPYEVRKIYVGGITPETTSEDLIEAFSPHGTVKEARIILNKITSSPRGFGFVTFEDPASVDSLVSSESFIYIHGNLAEYRRAQPKAVTESVSHQQHVNSLPGHRGGDHFNHHHYSSHHGMHHGGGMRGGPSVNSRYVDVTSSRNQQQHQHHNQHHQGGSSSSGDSGGGWVEMANSGYYGAYGYPGTVMYASMPHHPYAQGSGTGAAAGYQVSYAPAYSADSMSAAAAAAAGYMAPAHHASSGDTTSQREHSPHPNPAYGVMPPHYMHVHPHYGHMQPSHAANVGRHHYHDSMIYQNQQQQQAPSGHPKTLTGDGSVNSAGVDQRITVDR